MATHKNIIAEQLKKLEGISEWFHAQAQVDVEEGLKKVKEGAVLVGELKKRLAKVENEFQEIKKTVEEE